MAHGNRFRQQYGKVQRGDVYPPAEAMNLIKETASAGFDESVELHVRLGVNVKHAEEQLRGTLALPHGLGRDVRVLQHGVEQLLGVPLHERHLVPAQGHKKRGVGQRSEWYRRGWGGAGQGRAAQ